MIKRPNLCILCIEEGAGVERLKELKKKILVSEIIAEKSSTLRNTWTSRHSSHLESQTDMSRKSPPCAIL
jgi:hypothetical protein